MRKLVLIILISLLLNILSIHIQAQNNKQYFISLAPAYEVLYSQLEIRAESFSFGVGLFNQYKFHISGNVNYTFGKSLPETNLRTVKFHRISPGIKMKWLLLGDNRYKSDKYFDNLRLCLDFASHYNFAFTELYREDMLTNEKLVPYLSVDLGFSLLIPYGYVAKNTIHFLNHSDLYLEILGSAIINTDISILNSTGSTIDQVTTAGKLALNWMYYF